MASYANVTTIYVSEANGSDAHLGIHFENDRTMNGPVRTIDQALKIVAEMRRSEYLQPVTIALMDEEYVFTKTLEIKHPVGDFYRGYAVASDITFAPFGRKRTLFSGGKRVSGWAEDTFMGVKCLSVYLEDVKEKGWMFSDFYVNGRPAAKTRTPESGFFYPDQTENDVPGTHTPSRWFIAAEGDIPEGARNIENAIINFCHYWVDEHSRIAAYDPVTRKVTFDGRTRMTISAKRDTSASMPYYIENLAEAFKNPGEWYLDPPTGMLYYIPKEGETAENIVAYAPVVDRLINVKGSLENELSLHGIHFKNIAFAYTRGEFAVNSTRKLEDGTVVPEKIIADGQCCSQLHGVLNFEAADNCTVENCNFFAFGSHAVCFEKGCFDCAVEKTHMRSGAGGGVAIKGGDVDQPIFTRSHHNRVTDCVMENLGLRYFSASGVLITHGHSNIIAHNEIHDLYYSGVCVGWRWGYADTPTRDNLVMKNHIYDLGKGVLSDMGGVYTLGAQFGTRVEGNLIHDVLSRNYGGWGLYTDEGSAFMTFRDNICYNCSSNCYHQHYGYMNTIRNNVFAFAGGEAVRITRREAQKELLLENNIIVTKDGKPVYGNITACDFASDRNLIYAEGGSRAVMIDYEGKKLSLADVRSDLGLDLSSVEANPLFKNAKAYDFSLRKNSPAFKLGFEEIDMSDVGPRVSLYRM